MTFADIATYIDAKGGRFEPSDADHPVLHDVIKFAVSHSGQLEPQPGRFSQFEVVVTNDPSSRATGIRFKEDGLAQIPIGAILRSILAITVLRSDPMNYEVVHTIDPVWHGLGDEIRDHHPLVETLYSQSTLFDLRAKANKILSEECREKFEPILWYIAKFLVLHEKTHLERHAAISAAIEQSADEYRRRELALVKACDADCFALRAIADDIFGQVRIIAPNDIDLLSGLVSMNFRKLGVALFFIFTLMVPKLRSITAYDSMPYAHPQVRLASMANFIGKQIERSSNRNSEMAETAVNGFIDGAFSAVSGFWIERERYNKCAIERDPSFDPSRFGPLTSLTLGSLAQRRINDRAVALMNQRIAYLDDDEELWPDFQRHPPNSCRCSFLDMTREGFRST